MQSVMKFTAVALLAAPFALAAPTELVAPFDAAKIEAARSELQREHDLAPTLEDGLGIELVLIPAGRFRVGSSEEQLAAVDAERPEWWNDEQAKQSFDPERGPREVRLTRPYYLGAKEVTIGQFRRFVDATGHRTLAERDGKGGMYYGGGKHQGPHILWHDPKPGTEFGEDHPVTQVAHEDVLAFCRWLGEREGARYRLPTEAEWEFGARAGSETLWFFGDEAEQLDRFAVAGEAPAPVGSKPANAFGLHDVYGNVWELTADWFAADRFQQGEGPLVDPRGPEQGAKRARRGGNFGSGPAEARSAFRKGSPPDYRGLHVGFRVLREVAE